MKMHIQHFTPVFVYLNEASFLMICNVNLWRVVYDLRTKVDQMARDLDGVDLILSNSGLQIFLNTIISRLAPVSSWG